ncbi:secretion protein F [Faecalicatena orotica]|uniref:secretion protein F n=1 Tax=Faecalicatena orotica TaxID=1544 RepID=UPI0032177097
MARVKWNSVYGRMGMVFLSASVLSLLVYVADHSRAPEKNKSGKSILEREDPGEGKQDIDLEVRIGGDKESLTVTVGEQQYSKDKLPEVFDQAGKKLEELVLGENTTLDEVRGDLNLIERIPDTGIEVSWELDNYEVMNLMGELNEDNLREEGTLVGLRALLSYEGEEAVHSFCAKVFPLAISAEEKRVRELAQQIQKEEADSREKAYLTLPDELDGKRLSWKYAGDSRAAGLFVLGIAASGAVFALDKEKKKQQMEARNRQLTVDYPQLISQFTLFLAAGMTARKAWFQIAREYERIKPHKGTRPAYEEMVYAMHEIQGGIPEGECYERFGGRCGLPAYRKFGAMLSQNLRKGTKGLTDLLKKEAREAFEDRKNEARRLGEEAGTKLLGPMFMMLAVVLLIIVVPAFLTVQI